MIGQNSRDLPAPTIMSHSFTVHDIALPIIQQCDLRRLSESLFFDTWSGCDRLSVHCLTRMVVPILLQGVIVLFSLALSWLWLAER
jgi:hypothetical protein